MAVACGRSNAATSSGRGFRTSILALPFKRTVPRFCRSFGDQSCRSAQRVFPLDTVVTCSPWPEEGSPRSFNQPRSPNGAASSRTEPFALVPVTASPGKLIAALVSTRAEQESTMIRTIHIFQCGRADLYGITQDQTGANLPI